MVLAKLYRIIQVFFVFLGSFEGKPTSMFLRVSVRKDGKTF